MARYVAFLRGMNLGRRRLTNPELAHAFEALGFEGVQIFLASGNVVFDATARPRAALERKIEAGLLEALGYPVPTILRTAAEVRAIAKAAPFESKTASAATGKLQVVLLKEAPSAAARKAILALSTPVDRLTFLESECYWWPANGVSGTALDWKAIERTLGMLTVRTHNTLARLAAKFLT